MNNYVPFVTNTYAPLGGSGKPLRLLSPTRAGGLAGTQVAIEGLDGTFTDVLFRLEHADGSELTHRLTPEAPSYLIEAQPHLGQVAWAYFVLGVEHILSGIDHLLFILALLLVVVQYVGAERSAPRIDRPLRRC